MDTPPLPGLRYAVLQKSLQIPPVDGLRRAFASVRCLTAADAPHLARDAFGILVKSLPAEDAFVVQRALQTEGIATELVPEKLLPAIPPTKYVRQVEFGEDSLVIRDPLGRPVPIEYRHLRILAAGEVECSRLRRERSAVPGPIANRPLPASLTLDPAGWDQNQRARAGMVRARQHVLELILGQGSARFTIEADDNAHLLFQALGDRRTSDFVTNLSLLVRKFSAVAPSLLLNRGAYTLRADPPSSFFYPTQNTFNEELIWILWQATANR